ncbi:ABC transporter permease [Nonomuraea glycinis]|uniref:Peptide ABC transporter permease n=1 Tax=Nonomuraea glycinis TaxID=2047744 RepID=A0A918E4K2_9ACTN|nr:ABC transporter permease [Nonomuraea glycinis]MCA2180387.1 ABC transporter permease [Nonomuraea glycinis]GGP04123.1 peptide ABC transporter permease [Nonomuraea glycinis]
MTAVRTTPGRSGGPAPVLRRLAALPLRAHLAIGTVLVFAVAGLLGPLIKPYDSARTSPPDRLLPPGARLSDGAVAWLGTDQVGQDILAEVLAGMRTSLTVALVTVLVGGSVGLFLGLVAGYFGGWADGIISRVGDIQLAFPSLLLAILLAGVLGPSMVNVIIALAVTRWVIFARVVRGSAIAVRDREFVDSARVMGASHGRILLHYILPSCLPPLLVAATVQVGLTMVAEASLSFLGLGVPSSQASWGSTIAEGRDYLASAWWIAAVPGAALALVVVSIGILGDLLRDTSDPMTEL